ncbi:hypothetical protein ACQZ6C_10825 [Rhizobium rhizogenes]
MNTKLNAGIEEHLDTGNIGYSGKTIIVTKQGEDGGIEVDALTGLVVTATVNPETGQREGIELPGWASGLTNALLAERHIFYRNRLGGLYTDELKQPATIAFEDLCWVHVSELETPVLNETTGLLEHVELTQLDADHEFRMAIISEVTGIAGDIDLEEGTFGKDAITQAIARDNMRTAEELASMEQAKQEGFKAVSEG